MDVGVSHREEFRQVFLGALMDLQRGSLDVFRLVGRHGGDEFRRIPAPLLSRRNVGVGRDDRPRFEDDVRLDDGALQDGALFTDHHQVVDPAGFQNGPPTDGDVVADVRDGREPGGQGPVLLERGYHGALSDAGRETDRDGMGGIPTDYGSVPNAGLVPIRDLTDHRCGGCDEGIVRDKGRLTEKRHLRAMPGNNLQNTSFLSQHITSLSQAFRYNPLQSLCHRSVRFEGGQMFVGDTAQVYEK
mmetsp:Transcript_7272/g.17732  ORF Transcript_7272/g.17732 Transcript_7272/m.17732 type:complete len:244 (+) Transcript_7272:236-967(+)